MKSSTRIFVPLTDWEEYTNKRGLGVGQVVRKRKVLAADKWNWILAEEVEGQKQLKNEWFRQSLRSVIPDIRDFVGEPLYKDAINKVIGALVKSTNIISMYNEGDPFNNLYLLGSWLDRVYATSFALTYPPTVYQIIFKDTEVKDEDAVEASTDPQ